MKQLSDIPVRFSNLKWMGQSPAHYRHHALHRGPDTKAMRIGRGVHLMVEGKQPIVYPGRRWGKEWDRFADENAGSEILNRNEYDQCEAMADALLSHDEAYELLAKAGAAIEQRISWRWCDRICSGTPDVWRPTSRILIDLKTTRNANPAKFQFSATRHFSYHAQLAWYGIGVADHYGTAPERYIIVAVESEPPHPVVVYELSKPAIEMGVRQCRVWMERLLVCEQSNHWPGYTQSTVQLDVIDDSFMDEDGDAYELPEAEGF